MPPIPKLNRGGASRESVIAAQCLKAVGLDVVLFRNSMFSGWVTDEKTGLARHVRAGLLPKGMPDYVGLLPPSGRFVAIEFKAPGEIPRREYLDELLRRRAAGEELNEEQGHNANQWQAILMIRRNGGFAAYIDSVAGMIAAVVRMREGKNE